MGKKVPIWPKDSSTVMRCLLNLSAEDVFDELFKLAPEKVSAVKEVREVKSPRGPSAATHTRCPPALHPRGQRAGNRLPFHPAMLLVLSGLFGL